MKHTVKEAVNMPKFGKKMGSMKALKDSLKKGGSGSFIKFIPKNGEITVRFMQEPEEWVNYKEVFDPTIKKGYPLPDDEKAAGYDPDLRRSSRYLVNAVDIENDRVIALQLPKDLVNQLVTRYEKYGTMTDRDYELFRAGEGLETVYGCTPDAPSKRNMKKYEPLDLEQVLEDAYNAVFGADDEDDEEDEKPKKAAARPTAKKVASKRAAVVEDDDEDEDEDDEDIEEDEEDESDDDEEDEDEDEADDDEDDEAEEDEDEDDESEFWSEEELTGKTIGELRAIAKEYGIATKGMNKAALIEAIMAPEDDEEDF